MKEEVRKNVRELKVASLILVVVVILAALVLMIYSKLDVPGALEVTFVSVLNAGSGGTLGNIFYALLIFLMIIVIFYIFEKIIILLSQPGLGGIVVRMNLSKIKDHYIICGAGRVGTHAAEKLKASGKKVVIIENDCPKSEFLKNRGFMVVEGDCMNEEILERAQIRKAAGILACTGEDSKNVFVVLTAKDLNPAIKVATRVNDQKSQGEFERAGADVIVAPEIAGGYELADKIIKA